MKFVDKYSEIHELFHYYCEGKSEQNGIIRTNCLDSLDRTNFFQAVIGLKIFLMQMKDSGVIMNLDLYTNEAISSFKNLWVDNGNELCMQYTGTHSTLAGVTKNGKEGIIETIKHGFTSISRFFINHFGDKFKHKCIDVLFGRESTNSGSVLFNS